MSGDGFGEATLARLGELLGDEGDRRLLEEAVTAGRITMEQARQGVEARASAGSLGEVLVGKGWLSSTDLVELTIASQSKATAPADPQATVRPTAPAEAPPPETPSGRFRLDVKLGAGGMGEVWKAWDTRLKRWAALKFMKEESAYEVGMFSKEAQTAARLSHPHVAAIYEVGKEAGRRYIAMQYVEGVPLSKFPRSDVRRLVELVRQAALAVHYAHGQNVIHRDLKPANIMVEGTGKRAHAFVLDFGLAKTVNVDASISVSGAIVGTPSYMSPEQASGLAVDARTDVYSLGATLYELLTDKVPFDGSHLFHVIKMVIEEDPTPPRKLKAEVDPDLETIIQKCLDKVPARRYSNAAALAEELRRYLDGEPILAHPPSTIYRLRKRIRRNPWAWGLSASAVLVLLAGTILYIVHLSRARAEAETASRRAETRLAEGLVAQGDALLLAGRWGDARARYEEAHGIFTALGLPTLPADLGMGEAARRSPPPLFSHAEGAGGYAVALSPDGRRVISGGITSMLYLRDARTGRLLTSLTGHARAVWGIAFLPDGARAMSCSDDKTVKLWDLADGRVLRTFTGHAEAVMGLAILPDGRTAITGGQDGTVRQWDVETGREIRNLAGHEGGVYRIAVSPDGKRALSGAEDKTARLWELESGRETRSLAAHTQAVTTVAFSPDGTLGLTGSKDRDIKLWDLETGREVRTLKGHANTVWHATFSPDGRRILSASMDGTLKLWDLETGREIGTLAGHTDSVYGAGFFPGGRLAVSVSYDNTIRVWDVAALEEGRAFAAHAAPVHAVAVSPDGHLALSASADATVKAWDIATGRAIRSFAGHAGAVHAAAFSPDGRRALSGGADRTLRLWDLEGGREVRAFRGHEDAVYSIAFSPDGKSALSAGADRTVRSWDVESGREIHRFEGHSEVVVAVAFSPDGRHALSGSRDFSLRLWDVATGKPVRTLIGNERDTHGYFAVAYSPDGRGILAGTGREGILLVNASTGQVARALAGHTHRVSSVAFSPDGSLALSGSPDRTARLWDLERGREIRAFAGPGETVRGVAFSPDGRAILAACGNEVHRWELSRRETRALEALVSPALQKLSATSRDAESLSVLGRWCASRGAWEWAVEFLEQSRAAGAAIPSLELGRGHWQKGDLAAARREFEQALARQDAPASYLKLCLEAMEREGAPK